MSIDAVIDEEMLRRVIERGHSRVPVYEGNNKAVRRRGVMSAAWWWEPAFTVSRA